MLGFIKNNVPKQDTMVGGPSWSLGMFDAHAKNIQVDES